MRLEKNASGKQIAIMTKKEWTNTGKKAGWLKKANDMLVTKDQVLEKYPKMADSPFLNYVTYCVDEEDLESMARRKFNGATEGDINSMHVSLCQKCSNKLKEIKDKGRVTAGLTVDQPGVKASDAEQKQILTMYYSIINSTPSTPFEYIIETLSQRFPKEKVEAVLSKFDKGKLNQAKSSKKEIGKKAGYPRPGAGKPLSDEDKNAPMFKAILDPSLRDNFTGITEMGWREMQDKVKQGLSPFDTGGAGMDMGMDMDFGFGRPRRDNVFNLDDI